jgi:hypothetical protein
MGPAPYAGAGDKPDCSVDCHEEPGYARMAYRRYDVQFPPSPTALRAETDDAKLMRVLARQPVDMLRRHPFTEAGNREFSTFLWMPPSGARAGDIVLVDPTMFTTLFGGGESLERFWNNLVTRT